MAPRSSPSSKRAPRTSAPEPEPRASRDTIDVRPSWIEPDPAAPPPLAGAAADRDTLEVRPSWLEGEIPPPSRAAPPGEDPAARSARKAAAAKAAAVKAAAEEMAAEKAAAEKVAAAQADAQGKRQRGMRPSLDPGWLSAPPANELGRAAIPPPLPTAPAPASKRGGKTRP